MEKLFQALRFRADLFPHQPALISDVGENQVTISNQQLLQKITKVEEVLNEQKAKCIGLFMDNCSEWIICDLAAARLGVTLVPIPLFFTAAQIGHLAKSAKLDIIITKNALTRALTTNTHLSFVSDFNADVEPKLLPLDETVILPISHNYSFDSLGHIINNDMAGITKVTYTSGSTGEPKGVCLSSANIAAVCEGIEDSMVQMGISDHLCVMPLATLLENIANKSMLKGFEETEETFQEWTTRGVLTDFKATKRVDLNTFPDLLEVGEGSEYKYGTMGDRGESVQLATYGRMFGITRQAIINDDLSAFTRIPQKMGRAAPRTIGNLVYAILNSNPAMSDGTALFHADHKNLGSGAVLSSASVDAMRVLMATQKDPGENATALNIRLAHLIVPVQLEGLAKVVTESETEISATNSNSKRPNSVRGIAGVISDARLTGNAWFGAGSAAMNDTVEVSYLDGNESPYLEQQAGWSIDGVEFKVRLDAAVKAIDFRALAKNAGA